MGTEPEKSIALSRPQARSAVGPLGAVDAPFAMPFSTGDLIAGKYKIIELIGTGGVGFVVSARHVRLDELVAIKFLRPEFAANADAVRRFTVEARANFKIKNDHVVRVLDVDALEDGTPFMVMELLEGTDLGRVLATRGVLPVELAVGYVLQACEAIAAAHACYVVHRDIKPENLFITRSGSDGETLKVLDFGISKLALEHGLTLRPVQTLSAVGSPPYMSPEQVRAAEEVDARTDVWSIGCVLYELITGAGPFDRSSVPEICAAVLEDQPSSLCTSKASVPPALDAVVMRCLEKQPDQRYQHVGELALALAPFAAPSALVYVERCQQLCAGEGLAQANARQTPVPPPPTAAATEAAAEIEPAREQPLESAAEALGVEPSSAQPSEPEAPPAHDQGEQVLTEQVEGGRGSRGLRLALCGVAVLAVMYVMIQAVGANRRPAAPAREPAPVAQPHTLERRVPQPAAENEPEPEPMAEAEPQPAALPVPSGVAAPATSAPRKAAPKSSQSARGSAPAANAEPDVGF